MTHRRILITTSYLEPGDEIHRLLIDSGFEVAYSRPQDRQEGTESLAAALAGVDALIAGTDQFTADVIESAEDLKIIARTGAGFDNVDLTAASRCGVTVCTTPGANRQSVTELAIGMMLDCARSISSSVAEIWAGGWQQLSGHELSGATLGIIGLGDIGKTVATIATAMGMRVIAHDPQLDEKFAVATGIISRTLTELLAESDFVTLHINLSPQTYGLIGRDALALMKPSAYLINTSRGGIVDESALVDALQHGRLAGAALDVLETEPAALDSSLRKLPNLLITPHIGGATDEARSRSSRLAAGQIIDFFNGTPPPPRTRSAS